MTCKGCTDIVWFTSVKTSSQLGWCFRLDELTVTEAKDLSPHKTCLPTIGPPNIEASMRAICVTLCDHVAITKEDFRHLTKLRSLTIGNINGLGRITNEAFQYV